MKQQLIQFFDGEGYSFDGQGNLLLDEIDSVEFINLIIALENYFNIEIPDEFLTIETISSLESLEAVVQYAKEIKSDGN